MCAGRSSGRFNRSVITRSLGKRYECRAIRSAGWQASGAKPVPAMKAMMSSERVFLDLDGSITEIVANPDEAGLDPDGRMPDGFVAEQPSSPKLLAAKHVLPAFAQTHRCAAALE